MTRNPGMAKAEHEVILKQAFGVTKIIWAYGHDPEDMAPPAISTALHGLSMVTLWSSLITARKLSAISPLQQKKPTSKCLAYPGDPNWLVGNGFVVAEE